MTSLSIRHMSPSTFVVPTAPVCLKCSPINTVEKMAGGGSHGPRFARMLSILSFAAVSSTNLAMSVGKSFCVNLAVLPLTTGLPMQPSMPHYRLSLLT